MRRFSGGFGEEKQVDVLGFRKDLLATNVADPLKRWKGPIALEEEFLPTARVESGPQWPVLAWEKLFSHRLAVIRDNEDSVFPYRAIADPGFNMK